MKNITLNIFAMIALTITFTFNTTTAAEWVTVIEMGESGQRVVFPMRSEEISVANAENARLAAIRSAGFLKSKKPVVGFELAESGHSIGFPGTNPDKKIDLDDSVIARENSQKTDVRAQ